MKKSIIYLSIILFFMSSCVSNDSSDLAQKVAQIQQNNIKDKRLLYYNIEIKAENDQLVLSGETASTDAFNELKVLADNNNLAFGVQLLPAERFKKDQWAVVTLSVCNIRGKGDHSAELVTQAVMGTPVKVYKENNDWFLIQTPDKYFGWVDAAGIALMSNNELLKWKSFEKVLYKNQNGFAYTSANEKGKVEFDLVLADLLSVSGEENGFYKVVLADGREGYVKKDECVSLDIWKKKSVTAEEILSTAYKFKGVPYLWGGTSSKMVDCSGFVKSGFYYHGLILQRDASQQCFYGETIDTKDGYEVLQAGDLVFFGKKAKKNSRERVTHVGMCMGDQKFIHASGKVRINSLNPKSEKYTEHYEKAFIRAQRAIGHVDGKGIQWVVDNEFYKKILP